MGTLTLPTKDAYLGLLRLVRDRDRKEEIVADIRRLAEGQVLEELLTRQNELEVVYRKNQQPSLLKNLQDVCIEAIGLRRELLQMQRQLHTSGSVNRQTISTLELKAILPTIKIAAMLGVLGGMTIDEIVDRFDLPAAQQNVQLPRKIALR